MINQLRAFPKKTKAILDNKQMQILNNDDVKQLKHNTMHIQKSAFSKISQSYNEPKKNTTKENKLMLNQQLSLNQNNENKSPNIVTVKSAIDMIGAIKEKVNQTIQNKDNIKHQCLASFHLFLQYFNGKDIAVLYSCCKSFKYTIHDTIQKNTIQHILTPFIQCYRPHLKLINKKIIIHTDKSTKELSARVNFEVRMTLNEQFNHSTIIIENQSSWISNKNTLYRNIYKFDYHYKYTPSMYWVFKEETPFNYDKLHKAYIMPILSFQCNDIGSLSITIISSYGLINYSTFQWKKLKHQPIKAEINYEPNAKSKLVNTTDYSRICEIELSKATWIERRDLIPCMIKEEIGRISQIIRKNFSILSVKWDDIGYNVIKIKAIALAKGVINNDTLGINITIIPKDEAVLNEIKKNGLLYDSSNNLQLRVGDTILFYFSMSACYSI